MTTNTQQLAGLLQRVEGGSADLHPDDAAVDRFAEALKAKLACSRAKGRGDWDNAEVCSVEDLARMLIEHLDKANAGTFEDVATFAMMLHQRGADPAVLAEAIQARDAAAKREGWADMKRIAKSEIEQLRTMLRTNPPVELRATIDVANDRLEIPVIRWPKPEQPSPAPELERPEVAAWLVTGVHPNDSAPHVAVDRNGQSARGLADHWAEHGCAVEIMPLMTVAQYARAVAKWADLFNRAQDSADAAQARVAELERQLTEECGAHSTTIEQRDSAEQWADDLAQAIGEKFGVEIGEHSSLNCPWEEALNWIQADDAHHAPVAQAGQVPDDVESFLNEVRAELLRARLKFPGDRIMTIALAEEFGELCKAVLDEPAANVRKEAVQTAVMAARVVLDGDSSVTAWRAERGLDQLADAPQPGAQAWQVPAAWAVFADNGNVICWSQSRDHASLKALESEGRKVVPLYAAPEAQAGQVPDDWKLVPLVPTSPMTFAGQSLRYDAVNSIGEIYRQMIAAAPQPAGGDHA